ncbi:MAG: TonB-dependent receptor [Gemmatimonadota bacterium]
MRAALVAALIGAALPGAAAAQSVDVIRGRVTGPDSLPIENAVVSATTMSGNVSRTTRTDRQGRFTITFPNGEGDYMMSYAALGFAARRFEVKRVADEDVLLADTRLQRVNVVLDAVEVRAARDRVRRNDQAPDVSGTERTVATTEVPANLMGDLAAMAATLPGVTPATADDGSNGYSVLGLGADQNNTTLNGMSFGGSNLPRDAAVSTSLVTSPYDVSRGGFSGAQLSIRGRSGSNFLTRTMSLNYDNPAFQWTDAAARTLGQEYANASLGGGVSGPLVFDKTFYNMSYQLGRRTNDFQTLLSTDPLGLQAAGVASDSVTRLLGILGAQGIPSTEGLLRDTRYGDNGSVFGSIDLTSPSATSGRAVNILFNGGWGRQSPAGGAVTETPAFGGDRTNWRYGVHGRHSSYFGIGILTETSAGFSQSKGYGDPFLDLPAGRVRVNSAFSDGTNGVQNLSFGGSQSLNSTQGTNSSQVQNQLSWFSANNKHRLKLTSELRYETADLESSFNALGTFTYNSLADLQANAPASFSRTLSPRTRNIQQVVEGVSLGDSYRRTPNLQFTYGVRMDATQFLTTPAENLSLDTLYNLKNTALPGAVYFSPRAGFSWTYGTGAQIASFAGAQRGPRAVVRGGIGLFQSLPQTNSVDAAIDNTGLPSAVQQIQCVGSATPVPAWNTYNNAANIPTTCAGAPSVFGSSAPNVNSFASNYVSPRSLRGNLNWAGTALKNRFSASVDLTASWNLNQSSGIDRNFAAAQQFTLPGEDSRPVFVPTTSIVPTTGSIASGAARVSSRYSRVNELVSDLQSQSYQLTFRVSPMSFNNTFSWSTWYVYSTIREQFRGFSSTVSNPLEVAWGRSAAGPHQIGYSLGYNFFDFVRINWNGQFRAGSRFTPMVAGDVNGDGSFNDRAFLFNPAVATDTAVANGMQALLANGSAAARECLKSQLDQLAGRNTCTAPWTSSANLSISFNPLKVRMPQRASLVFQLNNPLYAADLLVHGSGKTRGWGQQMFPDNSLLYVRAFDAATQTYKYEVNRRFGATNPAFSQFRTPVTLTAMLRFDVGPTRERQMLTQQLDRGRRTQGNKAPELLLRAMFGNGGIPNPMAALLRDQDTLKLSPMQADSIATMNRGYLIKLDQVWTPIVKEFAVLPDTFEHDEAYHRYIVARRRTVDLMRDLAPHIRALLTADQYRRIPPFVASYLDSRYLATIRSGTAGFGSGLPGGFMPGGMEQVIMAGGGGGGMTVQIIRQ